MVIKLLTELGKRIDLNTDHFSKELENIKKTQTKIDNKIYEIKSTLEAVNIRLNDTEQCMSDLEDRIMEINQSEQQTERGKTKTRHQHRLPP